MATFNRSFGNNTPVTPADDPSETPNTKREEAKTGREVGEGVGDSAKVSKTPVTPTGTTKAPSGKDQKVWDQAESNALNGGGFAGLDDKAKQDLIQEQYDQMVKNDKAVKDWAGGDKEILGDVGQK